MFVCSIVAISVFICIKNKIEVENKKNEGDKVYLLIEQEED